MSKVKSNGILHPNGCKVSETIQIKIKMSKKLQKVVSITTSLTTIVWMSGVAMLAPIAAIAATTIVDGDTIKTADNYDVYIVKIVGSNMYKRLILNPEVFESYGHLSWDKIKTVDQATMDSYTVSDLVRVIDNPKVYQLVPNGDVGEKHWLNMSGADFTAQGRDWNSIYTINATDGGNYTEASEITGGSVVAPSTGLAVALASGTSAGAVAIGATDSEFAKINLTAGTDKAHTITSIAVRRSGVSNDTDISAVKLFNGSTQVGSTQAINTNSHKATFSGLTLTIGAGSTVTLTVKGSVAATAATSSQVILGVEAASDIVTDVTPSGSFPVNGGALTIAGVSVGNATVIAQSSPSGNLLSGSTDQNVASFKFNASSTEAISIRSIKLTENGTSADADTTNIKLKIAGVQIGATASALINGTVTFDLSSSPISVLAGGSKTVDVYTDVASGINTSRTIEFDINNVNDVVVVGLNSNGGIQLQNAFAQAGQALTVNQGSFTVALDTATNPATQTLVKGTNNNTMTALKFSAGANEGIRVTELKLTLTGTGSVTDVNNVAIYDNGTTSGGTGTLIASGAIVGTTITFGSNTNGAFDSSGLFDVAASGNRYITVKADIPPGATAANTVGFKVNVVGDVKIDGLSSMNDIASTASNITLNSPNGNNHTISGNGSLSISLSSGTPSAQTVAKNTSNITFTKFDLTASSEDIAVTSIVVRSYLGAGSSGAVGGSGTTTNVKLMDGSTQLGSTCTNTATNGTCTFSFSLTVPKNVTKTLSIVGDIPTNAGASSIHFDIPGAGTIADDISSTGISSGVDLSEAGSASGNLFTIGAPTLTVAAASTPAATTFVKSTIDGKVLTLLLTAGASESIQVSSIKIMGATTSGALIGANTVAGTTTTNVKLFDGSTKIGNTGAFTAGTYSTTADYVNFTGLDFIVPKGTTKQIDVKLTVGGSNTDYYFGVSTTSDVVASGLSSGASATVTLSATPSMGAAMTFASAGTLAVDDAADTPTIAMVSVGGSGMTSNEVIVRKIKFTATNEAIALTNINLYRVLGDNNGSNYESVSLYNGSTFVGTTYLTPTTSPESEANFNLSAIDKEQTVPKNGTLTLTVKATFNGTDNTTSGTTTALGLHSAGNIRGRGVDSGTSNIAPTVTSGALSTTDTSKGFILRKTKPTLAKTGLATSILTVGTNSLYKVTVSADSKGDIAFNKLTFFISGALGSTHPLGTDDIPATLSEATLQTSASIYSVNSGTSTVDTVAFNNFKMYNGSGQQITNGTFYFRTQRNDDVDGSKLGQGSGWYVSWVKTAATSEEVVAAGDSKTYELKADFVGSLAASGNSVITYVPLISSAVNTGATYADVVGTINGETYDITSATSTGNVGSTSTPSFVWSDKSNASHTTATADWTNDYLVSGLALPSQSLSY
ncbi:MAG: hypothetical protein COU81_02150 [Candidatus Portnoybacteria bacterium CG10_big_fil_rev_8_21_14_0_10_36_7]|uniref:Uncharacterized protein n=1 Tax=Candidatus Portnoybacteria bacterium CG10_big_fil_rev_8_21_14_0_10_36_7 TaxID=1974812 RepID=A0A2M8KE49_9BACT|nr:MAG: hypothetical protein COU81_02150 [Candidatus Portnoybacteria bacterium CG10_big_fil_rev_8_21_14_0_10_36_7]